MTLQTLDVESSTGTPYTSRSNSPFSSTASHGTRDSSGSPEPKPIIHPTHHKITKTKFATSTDTRGFIPVYEYQLNGQAIMIDTETGMVHFTGIWKALGHSKMDAVRLIESQPEIAGVIRKVRGGFLKIQGTWLPQEIARQLAARVAWEIRHDLVPLFGPDFPSQCIAPGEAGFGQVVLSSPRARGRRVSKDPEARAAAQRSAKAAQNNNSVSTSSQAMASKPIVEKMSSSTRSEVGPVRTQVTKRPNKPILGSFPSRSAEPVRRFSPYSMDADVVSRVRRSRSPLSATPPPPDVSMNYNYQSHPSLYETERSSNADPFCTRRYSSSPSSILASYQRRFGQEPFPQRRYIRRRAVSHDASHANILKNLPKGTDIAAPTADSTQFSLSSVRDEVPSNSNACSPSVESLNKNTIPRAHCAFTPLLDAAKFIVEFEANLSREKALYLASF